MSRRLSRVAKTVLILILWLTSSSTARAQYARDFNRIASVVEDAAGKLVLITTHSKRPLPPPIMQYLPGGDGEIILAADFPGVVLSCPARIVTPSSPGFKQLRIGQFQDNPPILRIAIAATNPAALKLLSFKATPGSLIVRFPGPDTPPLPPLLAGSAQAAVSPPDGRMGAPASDRNEPVRPIDTPESTTASSSWPPPATVAMSAHPALPVARLSRLAERAGRTPVKSRPGSFALPGVGGEARAIPQPAPPPSPALPLAARQTPPLAPEIVARRPILPAAATLATRTLSIRQPPTVEAQPGNATAVPPVAPRLLGRTEQPVAGGAPAAESQGGFAVSTSSAQESSPPVAVDGTGPVRVTVTSKTPLVYRTFRLHDPERYVLDIQGWPELAEASVPEPEPNPFVKKVRIGHPEGEPETVRVVLDLIGSEVAVREEASSGNQVFAIILDRAEPLLENLHLPPGMSVVIDAGHGGTDPGAQRGDIKEKDLTLSISDKLRKTLERAGVKVSMTRTEDATVSLEERVSTTNSISPDAFVSVHINSLEANSTIKGIETYYQSEQSQELARSVHQSLVEKLKAPDRSVRKARFYVINHTSVPAVLAEVGFISNKQEREKLISSDYQQEIANGIARGVILYLSRRADIALGRPVQESGPVNARKAVAGQDGDAKWQSLAQVAGGPFGRSDSKQ